MKIADIIQAMNILQSLHTKLKIFSQKLYTYLLKPLIKFQRFENLTLYGFI